MSDHGPQIEVFHGVAPKVSKEDLIKMDSLSALVDVAPLGKVLITWLQRNWHMRHKYMLIRIKIDYIMWS